MCLKSLVIHTFILMGKDVNEKEIPKGRVFGVDVEGKSCVDSQGVETVIFSSSDHNIVSKGTFFYISRYISCIFLNTFY